MAGSTGAQKRETSAFGFRMEPPTREEAGRFMRELSWEERFEVLSQGYHRGCYVEQSYSVEDQTRFVSRRNPRDPTGGVRQLDGEALARWVREVVGDEALAERIDFLFASGASMPEVVDSVRVLLNSRVNQYYEAFDDSDEY